MSLNERMLLLRKLGAYMLMETEEWSLVKQKAYQANNWFIPEFIDRAITAISSQYLSEQALARMVASYQLTDIDRQDKTIGLVMAGNIPLVGFHDFLCIFLAGFKMMIKPSSKDEVLIKHLVKKLIEWDERVDTLVRFTPILKGADAYIATGSNNSSRYFDYYFNKFPHIIRKNRTSIAVLTGNETGKELDRLADDVHLYFGMGCRNVTRIFVPRGYDFVPMLEAFRKYSYFIDHHKYKNNYEYYLAICLLNNHYYMTNGSLLLLENEAYFSPISVLHYSFYDNKQSVAAETGQREDIQCICGKEYLPFGQAQQPGITDYADGVDTMQFLTQVFN